MVSGRNNRDLNKENWQKVPWDKLAWNINCFYGHTPVFFPVLSCHVVLFSRWLLKRSAEKQATKNEWSREQEWQGKSLDSSEPATYRKALSSSPPNTHTKHRDTDTQIDTHTLHLLKILIFFPWISKMIETNSGSFLKFSAVSKERNQNLFSTVLASELKEMDAFQLSA